MKKEEIQKVQTILLQNNSSVFKDIAFIIDIDGTLILSHKQITNSSIALNILSSQNYPVVLLTNNISQSEQKMAKYINSTLTNLSKKMQPQNIILNYTPTKQIQIDWQNINVLLIGRESRFKEILPLQHIKKYVTVQQYCTIFPEVVPLSRRENNQNSKRIKKQIQNRLSIQNLTKQNLNFGAILILMCPLNWQQCYQVIMDLLNSPNGAFPSNKLSYSYQQNHIPVISLYNDMYFMTSECSLPRLLIRPFNQGLKNIYKSVYDGKQLNLKIYGKPQRLTYDYTEKHCQKYFKRKFKKFVMVGDSLQSDIKGPKNMGWDTILVKTGVQKKDSQFATLNAKDIYEGIMQYLKMIQKKNQNQLYSIKLQ